MITRQQFVDAVLQNAATVTHYQSGASGPGGCDCIGLIIGALSRLGIKWPGVHGTNWTARNYVDGLKSFSGAEALAVGDVVFKAREPGDDRYDLPAAYKTSPDQRDYYHVGTVTAVNPLVITHCTSVPGGIQRDNKPGQWKYNARLKCVTEGQEGPEDGGGSKPMERAKVVAPHGKTVNLRASASTSARILVQVPIGEEVDVLEHLIVWDKVRYQSYEGYMMKDYLEPIPDAPGEIGPGDEFVDDDTAQISVEKVDELRRIAEELLDWCDGVIGHG